MAVDKLPAVFVHALQQLFLLAVHNTIFVPYDVQSDMFPTMQWSPADRVLDPGVVVERHSSILTGMYVPGKMICKPAVLTAEIFVNRFDGSQIGCWADSHY